LSVTQSSTDWPKVCNIAEKPKHWGQISAVFPELWSIGCTRSPMDSAERQVWIDSAIDRRSTFFQTFAALARELDLNIAITYLEAHQPLPRNGFGHQSPRRGDAELLYGIHL
jgi:hypothetical protein